MLKVTPGGLEFDQIPWNVLLNKISTPARLYFGKKVLFNCKKFLSTLHKIIPDNKVYFSLKTNYTESIVKLISSTSLGAEVVSSREFRIAKESGFADCEILLDGIYQNPRYIDIIKMHEQCTPILSWLDSVDDLGTWIKELGEKRNIGLRFSYPTKKHRLGIKGDYPNDMGSLVNRLEHFASNLGIKMLACHAGSQLMNSSIFTKNCEYLLHVYDQLEKKGLIESKIELNLGGGFPEPEIATEKWLKERFIAIKNIIQENHQVKEFRISFEPGRYIVSDAGVLISKIKQVFDDREAHRWVLLDAGMDVITRFANNHLRIFSIEHATKPHGNPCSFQGRIPSEKDVFGKGVHFASDVIKGEHVVLLNCGAYGHTFSRRFSYPPPERYMINGDTIKTI